ncbi:hypothetical protein EV385_6636 [Krasilnikovia cinnamomea]|uniref:Uncharacterized protein n=1 Tax=Krasilnikovia cinnamomea TaxID=349313 RepID=A0A4Q7Z7R9_9ACTN|nr:hypothetical protein [Krasilnikovia cinnamomea]RZU46562.1 hypothetical protein EV385_6636 [Krasilnikovia cinnamomea]
MVSDSPRKKAIRARMTETGENYTTAARALDAVAARPAVAVLEIDPQLLVPYPDELIRPEGASSRWTPVVAEELGWRVLPADATPQQRAQVEAHWRPVSPARPCRCSGKCLHALQCGEDDDGPDRCPGLYIHVDRYPGGMFAVADWQDEYECNVCGEALTTSVELPAIPWGEAGPNGTIVYDNVRHPNFSEGGYDDGYDPGCFECGAKAGYRCTCGDEPEPEGCEECGAGGPYGCNC